jgi:hypothetical protein
MARLRHHVGGSLHVQGVSVCRVDANDLVGEFGRIMKVTRGLLVGGMGVAKMEGDGEFIPAVRVTTVVESGMGGCGMGEKDVRPMLWWSNADKKKDC